MTSILFSRSRRTASIRSGRAGGLAGELAEVHGNDRLPRVSFHLRPQAAESIDRKWVASDVVSSAYRRDGNIDEAADEYRRHRDQRDRWAEMKLLQVRKHEPAERERKNQPEEKG